MKKVILLLIFITVLFNLNFAQKNSITIKLLPGIGFADNTSFLATEFGLGFEFKKNRIEFNIQSGSKKRRKYINGDFPDAMMNNFTFTYSRFFTKNKFSLTPKLGIGNVTGRWKTTESGNWFDPNYNKESQLLSGFGFNYGIGFEYSLLKYLSLSLNYNEALLLSDLSGNRSILVGAIFKISKKVKEEKK